MPRSKQTSRQTVKPLITWTRFYLPREQEWPTWSEDHDDVYVGPLLEAEAGWEKASLGRMVDNPEQAAYIIGERYLMSETDSLRLDNILTDLVLSQRRMD